ncbi:alkaline phosphatase family protein [Nitrogeniibacter mangrovi]|uniref:Alkaline phosphatase family protein n=1 Tax=Nitrogeniibacter mangrovi TaxID=2016596 RepID=A0A6C1B453_9RHOO|nr:alkaline phosphatase family protein [Nitrogeniibacter mangrovi]QID17779.1 alkaline phosphatase family protein [Nitrogeniibacter mangrovi]
MRPRRERAYHEAFIDAHGPMFQPFLDLANSVAPRYDGHSLLNLSVALAQGVGKAGRRRFSAPPCPLLPDLSDSRIVVFILIDGMGANDVQRRGAGSFMATHQRATLTSVFPSTTASAVTTSMTGLSPAEHGLTGWFIRDDRFGGILAPLPMQRRDRVPMSGWWKLPRLFPYPSVFQRMRCRSAIVSHEHILGSPFNMRHSRGVARRYAYGTLDEMVGAIVTAVRDLGGQGGYVYAYHGDYDALAHGHGIASAQNAAHYARIDAALEDLRRRLSGAGAHLVITADHGFIDSPPERQLRLESVPEVQALLDGPLWGERRVAYCRVRRGAHAAFEAAVTTQLGDAFALVPSRRLLEAGVFGPAHRDHPRLAERVGDYALIGRENWTVYDRVPGEPDHRMIGVHGGVHPDEMLIPLVVAAC